MITPQTLEHSLETEEEKVCYLHGQHDAAFLHFSANSKNCLCPAHAMRWLQSTRHTEGSFSIDLACPCHILNKALNSCSKLIFPICSKVCKQVWFRQAVWHTLLMNGMLKIGFLNYETGTGHLGQNWANVNRSVFSHRAQVRCDYLSLSSFKGESKSMC